MTVEENVALGLKFRGLSKEDIQLRVNKWIQALGVESLAKRRASQLSGGEAQRVSHVEIQRRAEAGAEIVEEQKASDQPQRARTQGGDEASQREYVAQVRWRLHLDFDGLPPAVSDLDAEASFNYAWVSTLLEEALQQLEDQCSRDGTSTYWYLTAVPELMSLALARLEKKIGGVL